MSNKKPTVIVHRDSVTGQFVTPQYVERNPRTTETERRPAPTRRTK